MSNAQAERAINQIFDSDTVRSELRDEEASLLLTWGEARAVDLADHDLPESQFDDLVEKLRLLLVAINQCVGKRKTMPSQHQNLMADISNAAEAAGYRLTPSEQATFLQHQVSLTNDEAIGELLGLLKPVELPTPQAEPATVVEATAEAMMPVEATDDGDNWVPPQPEDLPELPMNPPQES